MKPGWTAGATRGRLMLTRTIGAERARALAAAGSLAAALSELAGSAYGERAAPDADLAGAERGVAATLLWNLRILGGWLPAPGAGLLRVLAAWFELQNVDARLAALSGSGREPQPFELGGLATAWPALDPARSLEELAVALADSAWHLRGAASAPEIALGLRVEWARRAQAAVPDAARWIAGAGALLAAREQLLGGGHDRTEMLARLPGLTGSALDAGSLGGGSLGELRGALAPQAAWALGGIDAPRDLWRAELGWWRDLEEGAAALLRTTRDEAVVLGVVALLAADAARAARALRAAAVGGDAALGESL